MAETRRTQQKGKYCVAGQLTAGTGLRENVRGRRNEQAVQAGGETPPLNVEEEEEL